MSTNNENDGSHQQGNQIDEPSSEIVALYCRHIPEYLSELLAAAKDNNEEMISFHCHKMKSAVKTMGFDNIAVLLETIENEKPKGEELSELCDRVDKLIRHTMVLLNK